MKDLKIGDKVKCTNKNSFNYNKNGVVSYIDFTPNRPNGIELVSFDKPYGILFENQPIVYWYNRSDLRLLPNKKGSK